MNVFLCDDAMPYRTLLRTVLEESEGLRVVGEACNGEECIAKVRQADPDVILLDLNMPKLDGYGAIPGLRETAPNAQIVMLSTSPPGEHGSECLRLGAHAYIQKPNDVFSLPGLLRAALA